NQQHGRFPALVHVRALLAAWEGDWLQLFAAARQGIEVSPWAPEPWQLLIHVVERLPNLLPTALAVALSSAVPELDGPCLSARCRLLVRHSDTEISTTALAKLRSLAYESRWGRVAADLAMALAHRREEEAVAAAERALQLAPWDAVSHLACAHAASIVGLS